jgi:DNA-binding NarL/FixJ family response regulator
MIRVLCVDDHGVVREGIMRIISLHADMEVVASAATGEEAVKQFALVRPDVTLMDLQMPGMNGLEATRAIRQLDAEARIVVLTVYQGEEDIYRALRAGAMCYMLKDSLPDDLVEVIRNVHAGGSPIPPAIASQLARRLSQPTLTEREQQVIELLASGKRSKEIAGSLGIAKDTVQIYLRNIFAKLKVHDRLSAITVAARRGLIRTYANNAPINPPGGGNQH